MNKSMLYGGLLALAGTTVYAAAPATPPTTPPAVQTDTSTSTATTTTPAPVPAKTTAQTTTQAAQTVITPKQNEAPLDSQLVLSCTYHIPDGTKTIDDSMVLKWSEKAVQQAFQFEYNVIDNQIGALRACFTDQGWKGFEDALSKSGNVDAIKSQQLIVSSIIDGETTITPAKENQWKVNLPLQVVYQNGQQKLTQLLNVDMLIGRKTNGDLGIMQMIAAPRQSGTVKSSTTTTTTTVNQ